MFNTIAISSLLHSQQKNIHLKFATQVAGTYEMDALKQCKDIIFLFYRQI